SVSDLESLLDVLYTNQIPGPKLIRLQREFCNSLGHKGQGNVYSASAEFVAHTNALQDQNFDSKVKRSALRWTECVVKHLRTDQKRDDVQHAFREISRLCHPSLRRHPNIVSLLSWGMSLDALEAVNPGSPSTPLLILERAHCDLAQFIKSDQYETVSYEILCQLCLDVGQGLDAVHSTGIIHGDMKLENVLIFSGSSPTSTPWTAKLCDFGSAVPSSAPPQGSPRYFGSDTWLPPECYEKLLLGQPLPHSLVPCDMFAYGLVVWATFVGIHFSPLYKLQRTDGYGADVARLMGQQRFYSRARDSVTASFIPKRIGVHQLLTAYTEQTLSQFGGKAELQAVERRQRRRWLQWNDVSENTLGGVENKLRRILLVLRSSLKDSPHRRELKPWTYFDRRRFPLIPPVENPAKFTPEYGRNRTSEVVNLAVEDRSEDPMLTVPNSRLVSVTYRMTKGFLRRNHEWAKPKRTTFRQKPWRTGLTHFQLIEQTSRPRQRRHELYERNLEKITKLGPDLQGLGPFEYLEHSPGGQHYRFEEVTVSSDPRVEGSHILPSGSMAPDGFDTIFAIEQLLRVHSGFDVSVLAWLCRGEVGQYEVQHMNQSPSLHAHAWRFATSQLYSDSESTRNFLLLFETGFDIHYLQDNSKTPFMSYLRGLDRPKEALQVAVHFQRIASNRNTSSRKRYFLTGRTSDLGTEGDLEELLRSATTTALHDAVRANNYPVVEFLAANGFNVSAPDSEKQLALDLALAAEDEQSAFYSIMALLKESRPSLSGPDDESAAPLGWEHVVSDRSSDPQTRVQAWRETSIEGDFDAITFIAPRTGFYETDRLTLGQIQGQKQVYFLDPFRFLKAPKDKEATSRPATKAFFDEDWYREDIKAIEKLM
ncbi:MAG: hypothetical protein LQ348_007266, partial [Seirophora lacunosa]